MDKRVAAMGRIVRYFVDEQREYAAVISQVVIPEVGVVNLTVFDPLAASGTRPVEAVPYSEVPSVDTWHWPDRS